MIYVPPDLKDIDLSFPGRRGTDSQTLFAIAQAQPGDPVTIGQQADRWVMLDKSGRVLSRFSASFQPPEGTGFLRGEVVAAIHWRKEDGDEAWHHTLCRDAWEVVVADLVFQGSS